MVVAVSKPGFAHFRPFLPGQRTVLSLTATSLFWSSTKLFNRLLVQRLPGNPAAFTMYPEDQLHLSRYILILTIKDAEVGS